MSMLANEGPEAAADPALLDQAVLEALAVRDTVFAIGDGALIELADTLLLALGQTAARLRADATRAADAARARLPVAA